MKKIVTILISLLAINTANASELSIIGHGFSKHLANRNYNEQNYGAGLRFEKDNIAAQIGAYRNSHRRDTIYAGIDWSPLKSKTHGCFKMEAGLYVGSATGYKYTVTPMAGVQAVVKCNDVFVRARAMPDPFYNSKAVGAIELGIVLKRF